MGSEQISSEKTTDRTGAPKYVAYGDNSSSKKILRETKDPRCFSEAGLPEPGDMRV
jgi:hypothetical protein